MRAQDRAYWLAQREVNADRRERRLENREDPIERREARREARGDEGGVFNHEARRAIREAARGRERDEASVQEP